MVISSCFSSPMIFPLLLFLLLPYTIIVCLEKTKKRRKSSSPIEIASASESIGEEKKEKGKIMEASTDFALSLLHTASSHDKSFVLSPFSLGAALAIIHDGAKGETQEELTRLLGKTLSPSEVSSLYSSLMAALSKKNKAVTTNVVNRFFLDKGFSLNSDYKSRVKKKFYSGAENIDFKNGGAAAAERINSFVSKNTGGMITNLVDSGSFSNAGSLLINAVYFKGAWATPFKEELTVTNTFFGLAGEREAKFMQASKISTRYSLTTALAVVSLPYKDPAYSLAVLMPTGDFGEWKETLTAESLQMTINNLKKGTINLTMPKFTIESTIDGIETLKKSGVNGIFSLGADLSEISENLHVSQIVHKAVIEICEGGTRAMGATCTTERRGSSHEKLRFDHPFVFILRREDTILFIGQKC